MGKTISGRGRTIGKMVVRFLLPAILLLTVGCAPSLYHIDVRYVPTKRLPQADAAVKKETLTVANFRDLRTIDDPLKVGYVLKPQGKKIYILPSQTKIPDAVTAGVREYFHQAGYSVSGVKPEWDLREETIDPAWGNLLVGGVINKLEVVCDDSEPLSPVKTYSAVVNLGITFADVARKRIVYRTSVEGSASLKDVSFSVEKLEGQLNGALADVIERLLAGAQFREELKKAAAR